MKIEVTRVLKNFDGDILEAPAKHGGKRPATIRWACVEALMAMYPDEQALPGEEKLKRYLLAQKVQKQKTPDLKSEEIAMIKQLVGKNFAPPVVGPVFLILEGKGLTLVEGGGGDEDEGEDQEPEEQEPPKKVAAIKRGDEEEETISPPPAHITEAASH